MELIETANLLLDIACIINFIALLWMLRAIIRNRNALRGYSVVGSFLTFISLVLFEFAYHLVGNLIGFAFGWATVAFWFITFIYTLKQKLETRKHEQNPLSSSPTQVTSKSEE